MLDYVIILHFNFKYWNKIKNVTNKIQAVEENFMLMIIAFGLEFNLLLFCLSATRFENKLEQTIRLFIVPLNTLIQLLIFNASSINGFT